MSNRTPLRILGCSWKAGGFKESSQHPDHQECCDGAAKGSEVGWGEAAGCGVGRDVGEPPSRLSPRRGPALLASDWSGVADRSRWSGVRRVGPGGKSLVQGRWRHAADQFGRTLWALPIV